MTVTTFYAVHSLPFPWRFAPAEAVLAATVEAHAVAAFHLLTHYRSRVSAAARQTPPTLAEVLASPDTRAAAIRALQSLPSEPIEGQSFTAIEGRRNS